MDIGALQMDLEVQISKWALTLGPEQDCSPPDFPADLYHAYLVTMQHFCVKRKVLSHSTVEWVMLLTLLHIWSNFCQTACPDLWLMQGISFQLMVLHE